MARTSLTVGVSLLLLGLAAAQRPGTTPENHPRLQTWKCTKRGGCKSQNSAVVLDSLAHPVHQVNSTLGCGDWGSAPNATVCPDAETCQKNCVMEGIPDYTKYGVRTQGSNLYLQQLYNGSLVSPRVYLLAENEKKYEMLKLTGNEFSFDVDVSKLPCGMNGALYLSEMEADGGQSKLNTGGAYYGTGYCDAQCFTLPFINGEGNIKGQGACCNEMDIWEANKESQQIAPHTCNQTSLYKCTGDECAFNGVCDKNGCGYNTYALGNKNYYGPGLKVDTSRPFTVTTQFPAERGVLKQIRRLYVQDGKVIQNAAVNISYSGPAGINYINQEYCNATGATRYTDLGGTVEMGNALSRGMVLIFSIWWDASGFMQWLDSGNSGPCNATEGDPKVIQQIQPDPAVTFSKVKWGEIGSTY